MRGLTIEPKDVTGHGPLAYVTGEYSISIQPVAGGGEQHDRGKFLWTARNMAGRWRFEYVI